MNPNPILISTEQLAELQKGQGITVNIDGTEITLAPPAKPTGKRFASLADLSGEVMQPKEVVMEVQPGLFAAFKLKPLDAEVFKAFEDMGREVMPPKKQKAGARGMMTEEADWEDAGFIAKRLLSNQKRIAFLITSSLVDFEVPGETLEEKSAALRKMLPPKIVDALFTEVNKLTSDTIVLASFS